ncbi:MAG: M28 family peptidase [Gammaproteobacteria bacterium]|nr:M28 family peptidase [Gammaproteobacteria bacterium]
MTLRFFIFLLLLHATYGCSKGPGGRFDPAAQAVAAPAPAGAGPFTGDATAAANTIDGRLIHDTVAEIAGDAYQGRTPGTEGDLRARAWLAAELVKVGFAPGAADGTWEQPFDLIGIQSTVPDTWKMSAGGKTVEFRNNADFIAASGVQAELAAIRNADIVFVGFGIVAPEFQWDDYKGMDLRGKVLLMLNNDPDWDPALFEGERRLYYGRWTYKYEEAARRGAVAAIIIHTTPSAGYPWQVVQSSFSGEQFELPAGDEPRVQVTAWVTEEAAGRLAQLAGRNLAGLLAAAREREFKPVALGVHTSLALNTAIRSTRSANVVGVLRGSDPVLADEVVVYSAHHDHLGVGEPNPDGDPDDRIYNGAVDNASGCGMVLSVARAFAALPAPPKRSIMVAFVGAEEQGLIGSEFFGRHPPVPAARLAANLNLDSGNILGATRDITLLGKGKSSLDAVADQVARFQGRETRPDQFPDKGYFYRSDQFNFAKAGVPALGIEGGTDVIGREPGWGRAQLDAFTERHYHQPSDELNDDWNFAGMIQDARFAFWMGLLIANAPDMPVWNPGDEFEAVRLKPGE